VRFSPSAAFAANGDLPARTRFADTGGWGYFNFNHHEPKAPTAKVKAKTECAFCHIASARKNDVWT